MTKLAAKPLPRPDDRSAGFWTAAADHVLALARCAHCGHFAHPPGVVCAHCLNTDPGFEFVPVPGVGSVRSWTVMGDTFLPGFREDLPFVLVDVELDVQPGMRLIGRLVDGPEAPLHQGVRVTVVFDDLAPSVSVPAFSLEVDG